MNDNLERALAKIVLLTQQNAEFGNELRKRLGMLSAPMSGIYNGEERLNNIEKYLGLDFAVDSKQSTVDYSFVKLHDVKEQLVSDNREMMRFRYGTRYHEIDFCEYCRYAQLQSEMLLNYYYDQKNGSFLPDIVTHIRTYNPGIQIKEGIQSLAAISYQGKMWAFVNEARLGGHIWDKIRMARNELSHRSVPQMELDLISYQSQLKNKGFLFYETGRLNRQHLKQNPTLKSLFDTISKTEEYKNYDYLLWRLQLPFDDVQLELSKLAKAVAERI